MNRVNDTLAQFRIFLYLVVLFPANLLPAEMASAQSNQSCDGFCLLDNFDDKHNGSIRTQGDWQTNPAGSLDGAVVTDRPPPLFRGKALQVDPSGVQFRGNAYLPLRDNAIVNDGSGTLFFQIYAEDIDDSYSHFGLTYLEAPRLTESDPNAPPLYTDFEVQFSLNRGHFTVKHGNETVRITNLIAKSTTLYNVWLVADNLNDTYEVYVQGGAQTEPVKGLSDQLESFDFRNGTANLDLQAVYSINSPDLVLHSVRYFDNIYIDPTSSNTANPPGTVPVANSYREIARFDSIDAGDIDGRNGWNGSGANVTTDPLDRTNKALQIAGESSISKLFDGVAEQTEGTLFFRMMRRGFVNASTGLSASETPEEYSDFEVQLNTQNNTVLNIRDDDSFKAVDTFTDNQWYCV